MLGTWALPLKFQMRPLSHSDTETRSSAPPRQPQPRLLALSTANGRPNYSIVPVTWHAWPADEAGARECERLLSFQPRQPTLSAIYTASPNIFPRFVCLPDEEHFHSPDPDPKWYPAQASQRRWGNTRRPPRIQAPRNR
jgi:hypothetical protein